MAAEAADDKQAENIVILDMEGLTVMTDYFVICSGTSNAQVRAITTGIREAMAEAGLRPVRREGDHNSRWVLMDYGGVVIHVFHHTEREFYDLERLWDTAPRLEWAETASPK